MIFKCSTCSRAWLPRILTGGRWARGSFICPHCGAKHRQRLAKSDVGQEVVELREATKRRQLQ